MEVQGMLNASHGGRANFHQTASLSLCGQLHTMHSAEEGTLQGSSPSDSPSQPRRGADGQAGGEANGACTTLYVSGLVRTVSNAELAEMFRPYGELEDAQVVIDPHTRENRGFGFISYVDSASNGVAIAALHNRPCGGRTLSVEVAKRRRPRSPTPGQYQGSSRGRSDRAPSYREPVHGVERRDDVRGERRDEARIERSDDRRPYDRRDYDRRDYDRRDYARRDYDRRDYDRRDYERRDYERRDYERRDYERRDEGRDYRRDDMRDDRVGDKREDRSDVRREDRRDDRSDVRRDYGRKDDYVRRDEKRDHEGRSERRPEEQERGRSHSRVEERGSASARYSRDAEASP